MLVTAPTSLKREQLAVVAQAKSFLLQTLKLKINSLLTIGCNNRILRTIVELNPIKTLEQDTLA